jgi:hypothetical protein
MEERYRQRLYHRAVAEEVWPLVVPQVCCNDRWVLLSRLQHYCHTVHIKGPSLRDLQD